MSHLTITKINIRLRSETISDLMKKALTPETKHPITHRSKVKVYKKGRNLILHFKAKDTSALRASVNTYLSWLQMLAEIFGEIETTKIL